MRPPSLKELAAQQKAAGLVAPRDDDDGGAPTSPPVRHEVMLPVKDGARTVILKAEASGYIRLLPPTIQTIKDLTPEWLDANWAAPSPWCRIEGQPDHPEFEANLKAWEQAQ